MKRLSISTAAVMLYAGVVLAQTPGDKPAAAASNPPGASGMTLVTGNEAKHAREADARHCLNLKSDREIMRCAEKYRYRAAPKASGT